MDLYGQDSETVDGEQDLFKPEYKKYKRKDIKLDLGNVIDFTKQNNMDSVSFFCALRCFTQFQFFSNVIV